MNARTVVMVMADGSVRNARTGAWTFKGIMRALEVTYSLNAYMNERGEVWDGGDLIGIVSE